MKILISIFLTIGVLNSSLGCCIEDNRGLTEMLFQGKPRTVFTCKVLTFSTPNYPGNRVHLADSAKNEYDSNK